MPHLNETVLVSKCNTWITQTNCFPQTICEHPRFKASQRAASAFRQWPDCFFWLLLAKCVWSQNFVLVEIYKVYVSYEHRPMGDLSQSRRLQSQHQKKPNPAVTRLSLQTPVIKLLAFTFSEWHVHLLHLLLGLFNIWGLCIFALGRVLRAKGWRSSMLWFSSSGCWAMSTMVPSIRITLTNLTSGLVSLVSNWLEHIVKNMRQLNTARPTLENHVAPDIPNWKVTLT